ncbi:hypothetical protein F5Y18DRAFT_250050 [Xylariaceae sp. FL1019]|nr:hypothetical protein F5Y18DRAFT_250050 [Xylariaceae sp. FL1019]
MVEVQIRQHGLGNLNSRLQYPQQGVLLPNAFVVRNNAVRKSICETESAVASEIMEKGDTKVDSMLNSRPIVLKLSSLGGIQLLSLEMLPRIVVRVGEADVIDFESWGQRHDIQQAVRAWSLSRLLLGAYCWVMHAMPYDDGDTGLKPACCSKESADIDSDMSRRNRVACAMACIACVRHSTTRVIDNAPGLSHLSRYITSIVMHTPDEMLIVGLLTS